MGLSRLGAWMTGVAVVSTAALSLLPGSASARAGDKRRAPPVSFSLGQLSAFTPASADPRLAATFAGRTSGFKFTPAAARTRPAQIRVALRAQASPKPQGVAATTGAGALTPTSYNLGVAVGWKRFAVTGDVDKIRQGNPAIGGSESAMLGVNYNLKRFTGRVALGGEHNGVGQAASLTRPNSVQVDLGGAYRLTRNLAVTGGVRYKVEDERLDTLRDQRADSKAVYVGTAFKF